ncbi:MAG: hypothetical protein LBT00_02870 [Spirochaetaceae bacterium]|jgi:hypothetical protein|nr:hypothetical protein [Spirochaetaceae bacterium]
MEGLVETSNKVDAIVSDLFDSVEREQVNNVFEKHSIKNMNDRIKLLQKCMQVTGTSDSGEKLPAEDQYADELEIFVYGRWRSLID